MGFAIVFGMVSYLTYYAIDFNKYFLENEYSTRKSKCKFFDESKLKEVLNSYGFDQNNIKSLEYSEGKFDALFMHNDTSKHWLILVHGKRECPYAMIRGGYRLHKMGYSIAIPVLYAHGNDSLHNYIDYGKYSIEQIHKCVEQLEQYGAEKTGIIGRSMGASLAIIATAQNPNIDAVIAECPLKSVESSIEYKHSLYSRLPEFPFLNIKYAITYWQLDTQLDSLACINFVDRISPRPLFIMAATEDKVVNPKDFEEIYSSAREPKIIWREQINHTKFHSTLKDDFYKRVPEFFDSYFNMD